MCNNLGNCIYILDTNIIVMVDAVIRTPSSFCESQNDDGVTESFCRIPVENSTSLLDNIVVHIVPYNIILAYIPALNLVFCCQS